MKFRLLLLFMLLSLGVFAQEQIPNRFIVTQKVDTLLSQRGQCFAKVKTSHKYYHIQLYNGQSINTARSIKAKFQEDFPEVYVVVEWESPEFKVWAGEYENKLSADQALLKIRKKYPNAFVVNPKK